MQSPSVAQLNEYFRSLTAKYLPLPMYNKQVTEEMQLNEIELLKETVRYERFFFVLDLHHWKIRDVYGVDRWLGYSQEEFDMQKFLSIMHPVQAQAHNASATILIEGSMRGDWLIEFMKHRYVTQMALRNKDGEYLLCKRLASVFQYSDEHKLLEYINEFTILGPYREEPYSIRVSKGDGSYLDWEAEMIERIKTLFRNKNQFSFQEIRILRKYAYHPDIDAKIIAELFKIKLNTLHTHHQRILKKGALLFMRKFESAREIAHYMKDQWLL